MYLVVSHIQSPTTPSYLPNTRFLKPKLEWLFKNEKKKTPRLNFFINQIVTSHWTQIYFSLLINDNKKEGTTIFEVL
jgi:hypothetical protein